MCNFELPEPPSIAIPFGLPAIPDIPFFELPTISGFSIALLDLASLIPALELTIPFGLPPIPDLPTFDLPEIPGFSLDLAALIPTLELSIPFGIPPIPDVPFFEPPECPLAPVSLPGAPANDVVPLAA